MTNTEGIVLKLLLHSKNSEQALLAFSKLKEKHFTESYKPVYRAIVDFYSEMEALPSINDLLIFKSRSARVSTILSSLKMLDIDDLEMDVAVEALIDQHSQDVVLGLIDSFVDDLPLLNTKEMVDYWGRVGIEFENEIDSPEQVSTLKELSLFPSKDESLGELVVMGLSNKWDSEVSSRRQELALYGGRRGSGKSILCANLVANQMAFGNIGVYCTIEMTAKETFQRIQSIGSQVPYKRIRDNDLTEDDVKKIAYWAAQQYVDGTEVYERHFNSPAPKLEDFEKDLKATCELKEEGRLVIIDDRELSLASIDVQLRKLKAKYGEKLKLVVIDYLNQVVWDGHESDMYDWKVQTIIAKQIKNLARKYDVLIVSPYQMDDKGEARFSKGILDACDTAQLIEPDKETSTITLTPTKVRNSDDGVYTTVNINWECLTVHPEEVNIDELKQESAETEEPEFNAFPSAVGELV